ncbi:MAG: hypothetical protein KAG97_08890 [Victivallales bacterium]|nr:hypothetical protein [Victivallales bacterium]
MKQMKVSMIGAGSGFVLSIARELGEYDVFQDAAFDNLPREAVLDVPALAIGGEVRSIHVGELPICPLSLEIRESLL